MSPKAAGEGRRNFLDAAIRGGLTVCLGGMTVPTVIYLLPAQSGGPEDELLPAGPAEPFEPGTARMIQGRGRPILVLALPGGTFRAFSAICSHLGCVVHWNAAEKRIVCPCHAGYFDAEGKVQSGPPPRPLPAYEVLRVGDELKVRL